MESKKPEFSLASPEDKRMDDDYKQHLSEDGYNNSTTNHDNDTKTGDGGGASDREDGAGSAGASSPQNIPLVKDEDRLSGSDLSFTKRDIRKSRTQSFQSVLSTASLKLTGTIPRNSSQISNSSKNFQSFIQAPALSSINPKNDDIQIGVHSPFQDKTDGVGKTDKNDKLDAEDRTEEKYNKIHHNLMNHKPVSNDKLNDHKLNAASTNPKEEVPQKAADAHAEIVKKDIITHKDSGSDEDTSNLTFAALKKLSKSPLPINNEPYKPAKVDLSSFASLTRQSKSSHNLKISPEQNINTKVQSQSVHNNYKLPLNVSLINNPHDKNSPASNNASSDNSHSYTLANISNQPVLSNLTEKVEVLNFSNNPPSLQQPVQVNSFQQQYPSQLPPPQVQQAEQPQHQKPKVPAAVTPPTNMIRRESNQNVNSTSLDQPLHNQPNGFNKTTKQLHQIKGLRNPMYIPAVLRVTQSMHDGESPFDHLQKSMTTSSQNSISSVDSNHSQESNTKISSGIGNRNYEEILRAPPTRKHWLKDETVLKCCIPSCPKVFNFFERRHHCRKCGKIYCKEHTSHYLYINHLAQFTTGGRGTLCKVCDLCIEDYNEFIKVEFGISNMAKPKPKPSSTITRPNVTTSRQKEEFRPINKNLILSPTARNGVNSTDSREQRNNDQLVGSVPANWSWSSF